MLDSNVQQFEEAVMAHFSSQLGDEVMTAAQELRQQGINQRNHEIAKKLLTKHMPVELIAETTELDIKTVNTLKKEQEPTQH